ncbi:hypothetical protein TGAM01_v201611 [Trichoderma gamsii]|uniref:Uncharacterized protein n=1 Tax=Trichoderma gamsii TaxID=398673 RepID=A0A2P4ZYI9_9HYPO|nr:hypothetical protein TGAM01_v201611 [Trichoderma gamsii]PON29362.1 hypothetical protein TGAM01_v201611 [Trichoderma gamsii]
MPALISKESYSSENTGNRPAADPNLQLAPCSIDPMERHHAIIAIPESQPSGDSAPRSNAVLANQRPPLPSFDVAHNGWDASNVSTAKCDLCHKQRCGTLQKCRDCKLSICQECCVAGRLQNDRRHTIDATAVSWDVPPNIRKRKNRNQENNDDPPNTVKKQRAAKSTRQGQEQCAAEDSTETSILSTADNSPAAKHTPVPETDAKDRTSDTDHNHGTPIEPPLSVAPAPHYSPSSCTRYTDAISSRYPAQDARSTFSPGHRRLPFIEEPRDSHDRNWVPSGNKGYPLASIPHPISGYPVSTTASRIPQDVASRPVLPPISLLVPDKDWQQHQPAENLWTSMNFVDRLEDLLHPHQQPTRETWPQNDYISSLGTKLADAARRKQMSSSHSIPLDGCLRDEIQSAWESREFIARDRDAGCRYRQILAAAYFASTHLGLSPQFNVAREWLREKEFHLREMGYEPTKSRPLMNFLQEVGVWYLRQVQW